MAKESSKKNVKKTQNKQTGRMAKTVRATTSELKKVTWPSFARVVKQTGVVIAVVLFFAVVLFAIDRGLSFLYEFLISKIA